MISCYQECSISKKREATEGRLNSDVLWVFALCRHKYALAIIRTVRRSYCHVTWTQIAPAGVLLRESSVGCDFIEEKREKEDR